MRSHQTIRPFRPMHHVCVVSRRVRLQSRMPSIPELGYLRETWMAGAAIRGATPTYSKTLCVPFKVYVIPDEPQKQVVIRSLYQVSTPHGPVNGPISLTEELAEIIKLIKEDVRLKIPHKVLFLDTVETWVKYWEHCQHTANYRFGNLNSEQAQAYLRHRLVEQF